MLRRVVSSNGLTLYQSPLLAAAGVRHAFSTRLGGVSSGPMDSLNLVEQGDDPANVRENYRRLLGAIGCADCLLTTVRQVHGCNCVTAPASPTTEADALTTSAADVVLAVRVADCVPILLADRRGRAVAAVHAGWRGIVAGVVAEAVRAMSDRHGVDAHDLVAAVGPCLSLAHFEVGPEVADAFADVGLSAFVHHDQGAKPHIDMAAAVVHQLQSQGARAGAIDTTDRCTWRDADAFFSHRRDRGRTGRMAAVIARGKSVSHT